MRAPCWIFGSSPLLSPLVSRPHARLETTARGRFWSAWKVATSSLTQPANVLGVPDRWTDSSGKGGVGWVFASSDLSHRPSLHSSGFTACSFESRAFTKRDANHVCRVEKGCCECQCEQKSFAVLPGRHLPKAVSAGGGRLPSVRTIHATCRRL